MSPELVQALAWAPWLVGVWLVINAADRIAWHVRGGSPECCEHCAYTVEHANEVQELRGLASDSFGALETIADTLREIRDQPEELARAERDAAR